MSSLWTCKKSLEHFLSRFDKEKHAGVCKGCDVGHRPMNILNWSSPEPCPQCKYSNKAEDAKLLERYKVGNKN